MHHASRFGPAGGPRGRWKGRDLPEPADEGAMQEMITSVRRASSAALGGLTAAMVAGLLATAPAAAWVPPSDQPQPESPALTTPAQVVTTVHAPFDQARSADWGTVGDRTWQLSGKVGPWNVNGGTARVTVPSTQRALALLSDFESLDTDVVAKVAVNKAPRDGQPNVDVIGRQVGDDVYGVRVQHGADGRVKGVLLRRSGGVWYSLGAFYADDTVRPGIRTLVRVQVTGANPTTVRAKVWRSDRPEPAAWGRTTTDGTTSLQVPGTAGIGFQVPRGVSNGPIMMAVDDFAVTGTVGAPVTPRSQLGAVGSYVPDASTTGAPAGTRLTVHQGNLVITEPNTVIDGRDVRGFVVVRAPGAVIRNSVIRGGTRNKENAVVQVEGNGTLLMEDTEVFNSVPTSYVDGVRGSRFTLRRVNIHHVLDPVHIYGDDTVVEASYLHDNYHYENDPAWGGNPSHDDSVQINSGSNHVIRGNSISGAFNTGIQLTQNLGNVSGVLIEQNVLDGGGCTINFAEKGRGPYRDVTIRDNVFGRTTKHANCAIIAPTTSSALFSTSGNVFTDGQPATVRRG